MKYWIVNIGDEKASKTRLKDRICSSRVPKYQ